jgi:hypothetical protein
MAAGRCPSERRGYLPRKVADLEASLNAPEIRAEASDALRALIEPVVLTPDADAPDGQTTLLDRRSGQLPQMRHGPRD